MSFFRYFVEPNLPFGGVSWAMVVVWAATLAFGVYLLRSYRDANPLRMQFVRQAGLVTTVISGLGLGLLLLKWLNVPVLEWRLWSYLVTLVSIGFAIYAINFYTTKLPTLIAAARPGRATPSRAGRQGARTYNVDASVTEPRAPRPPRPSATTTRREARRDKKRRGR